MGIARLWSIPVALLLVAAACSSGGSGSTAGSECTNACPGAVAVKCTLGPPSESECESGCATIRSGSCGGLWDALFACGGPNPQYTCDSHGQVSIAGCETKADALYSCLAGGGSGGSPATGGSGGSGG